MIVLKRIGLVLVALIALVLIAALFVQNDYEITREITINKPRAQVFSYIKMLQNQNYYSKWAMADPAMKQTFRGTDGTPGFVSAWDGNSDVGKGEQEIKAVAEGGRLDTELRFEKPMKSVAGSYIATEDAGAAQTKVRWGFKGKMPYPLNIMRPFAIKGLGNDLQTSLEKLKSNLESTPL